MSKDYKYGLLAGTALVIIIAIWFVRNPRFSIKNRALDVYKKNPQTNDLRFVSPLPQTPPPPEKYIDTFTKKQGNVSRFHIVATGETLSGIAERYYGSKKDVSKILKANPLISDANVLKVGMRLAIPD